MVIKIEIIKWDSVLGDFVIEREDETVHNLADLVHRLYQLKANMRNACHRTDDDGTHYIGVQEG